MRKCPKCGKLYDDNMRFCIDCGVQVETAEVQNNRPEQPASLPQKGRRKKSMFLAIFFGITTIISAILLYMMYDEKQSYYYRYHSLRTSYNELSDQYSKAEEQIQFMDNYVVIVPKSTDEDYYHKYGCEHLELDQFWIYNTNAAAAEGYQPCPFCID